MRYFSLLLFLFVVLQVTAQSTVESIPNQKLNDGSYVSNPDGILDAFYVGQIDSVLRSMENETTVQVAVVAVESIGDRNEVDFSQELFERWGIGHKENNNGLLILLVRDQRVIRFHTGDGIEGVLPDVVCKRIQRDYMLPDFKAENYGAGILAGVAQVRRIVTDPDYAEELRKQEEVSDWVGFLTFLGIFLMPALLIVFFVKAAKGRFSDSKNPEQTPYPEMRMKRLTWLLEFVVIPVLIIVMFGLGSSENAAALCFISLYLYFMFTLFHRLWRMKKVINRFMEVPDYYEVVEFLRKQQWYWLLMAFAFPLPFAVYFFYHLARKKIYRNHPRNCKQCQGAMRKLDEKADDEFLSEGQRMEENLRSVDYDVWKCEACAGIEVWFYLNNSSKYTPCPKCKTIAYHSVSRRTVVSATYSSSGTGEESHACKYCGYQHVTTYSIAQLTRSSSSSSGSSFSSSSGGSWGGGSSGGGGASSRW
jgi:uncharacterized protein